MKRKRKQQEVRKYALRFAPLFKKAMRKLKNKQHMTQIDIHYVYIGLTKEIMELRKANEAKQQIVDGLLRENARLERRPA